MRDNPTNYDYSKEVTTIYRACSRCGKIHDTRYRCMAGKVYKRYDGEDRELRNTWAWHKKAAEIKERANYLCEVCRDNDVYTYEGLEVHHIEKVRDNPTRLLDNLNLVCLCVMHHKQADKGEIEADYLKRLAEGREGRNIPPTLSP